MTEYYKIGKIVGTFGYKGEVVLKHSLGKKTSLKGLKAIFLEEKKEAFIPWFIESVKIKSDDELYLKLEQVDDKEHALPLTQKEVWLKEEDFKKHSAASAPINLLGYDVVQNKEVLGSILEVIEQPHQLLCRIEWKGKEALIPLHGDTIKSIDRKAKKVVVELPEGLLEIYQ